MQNNLNTNNNSKIFSKTSNNNNQHWTPPPLKCPYGNRPESGLPEYRTDAAYRCYFCCFCICCGCFSDADKKGKVLPQVLLAKNSNIGNNITNNNSSNNNLMMGGGRKQNQDATSFDIYGDGDSDDNTENGEGSNFSIFFKNNHHDKDKRNIMSNNNKLDSSSLLCPLSCWPPFLRCPQCNNDKNSLELHVSPPFEWICETWTGEDFRSTKLVSTSSVLRKQTDGGASHEKVRAVYHSVRGEFMRRRKTTIAGKVPQISSCFLGIVASSAVPRKLLFDDEEEENTNQKQNNEKKNKNFNNVHDDDGDEVRAFSKPPADAQTTDSSATLFTSTLNNSSGDLQPINHNTNKKNIEIIDVDEITMCDDGNDDRNENNDRKGKKTMKTKDFRQNPRLVTNYTLNPIELVKFPDSTSGETFSGNNNNSRPNFQQQQQQQQSFMSYFNNTRNNNSSTHNNNNNNNSYFLPPSTNTNNNLQNNTTTTTSTDAGGMIANSRRCREDEEWQHNMPFACKVPPIRAAFFLVRGVHTELLIRSLAAAGNGVHSASRGACCREGESFAYFLHNMDGLETELIWFGVPHRLEATGAAPTRDSGQILEDSVPVARVTAPPSALSSVRPQILHVPQGSGFSELRLMQGRRLIGRLGDAASDRDSSDDDEAGRMIHHERAPLLTVTILLDTNLQKRRLARAGGESNKKKIGVDDDEDDAASHFHDERNSNEVIEAEYYDFDPLVGGAPTLTKISLSTTKQTAKNVVSSTNSFLTTKTESLLLKDQATGEYSEPSRVFSKLEAANIRTAIDFLLSGTNVAMFGLGSKRHILSAISRSDKLASFAIHIIDGTQIRDAASMATSLSAAAAAGASATSSSSTTTQQQQQQQQQQNSHSFSTCVTATNLLPGGGASSAFIVSRLAERGLLQHYVDLLRRQIERYDQEWEFQFYLKEVRRAHRRAKKLARLPLAQNTTQQNNSNYFECVQHSFHPITTTPGAKAMNNATNLTMSTFKNPNSNKNNNNAIPTEEEEIYLSLKRNKTMNGRNHQQQLMFQRQQIVNQKFLADGPTPFVHPLLRTPAFQQQKVLGVGANGNSTNTNTTTTHNNNNNGDGILFLNHQIKIFKPPEAATLENESMTDLLFFGQRTVPLPNLPREKECTLAALDNQAGKICIGSMKQENIRKIFGPASSSSIDGGANLSMPELLLPMKYGCSTKDSATRPGNNNFYHRHKNRGDDGDSASDIEDDDDDDNDDTADPTARLLKTTLDTTPLRHLVVIVNADWIPPSILAKIAEVVSPSGAVSASSSNSSTTTAAGKCGRAGRIVTLTCFDDPNFLRRCAMSAEISSFRFKLLEVHTMAPYVVESTVLSDAFTKFLDATAVMETDEINNNNSKMKNNNNNNGIKRGRKKKNAANNDEEGADDDDEDEIDDQHNNNNMMMMTDPNSKKQKQKPQNQVQQQPQQTQQTQTNLRNNNNKVGAGTAVSERRKQEIERSIQSLPQAYKPRINLLAKNQVAIGLNTVSNMNLLVNSVNNTPGQQMMTADQMRTMIQELSSNHLVFWNRSKHEVRFLYPETLIDLTK